MAFIKIAQMLYRLKLSGLMLLFYCVLFSIARAEDVFKAGYFAVPLHTELKGKNSHVAPGLEYFKLITQKMGISHLSLTEYPLARLLMMAETDKIDAIVLLANTAQRQKRLVFSSVALSNLQPVLVLLQQHPLNQINSVEDLIGLKIGVWQASVKESLLDDERIHLSPINGNNAISRNLKRIDANRIDALYNPDLNSILYELRHGRFNQRFKILNLPTQKIDLNTAFSPAGAKRYKAAYEKALAELQQTLNYDSFIMQYLQTVAH
mgnify:CR=1 FL=1